MFNIISMCHSDIPRFLPQTVCMIWVQPTIVMSGMNVDRGRTQWIITCHEHVTRVTCPAPPSALTLWPGQRSVKHVIGVACFSDLRLGAFYVQSVEWEGQWRQQAKPSIICSQAINVAKPCFDHFDLFQMTSYIFRHDRKFKYLNWS